MKIVFLGTNGWYDTHTGNTACVLLQTDEEHIVLDAGNGFFKLDRYIRDDKPIYLFLSHFHYDHISGLLHIANRFDFRQGIHVYGPKDVTKLVGGLIRGPYTKPLGSLRIRIRFNDLSRGAKPPVNVEFRKLRHPSPCYGYRFVLECAVVAYCTDTAMDGNIVQLGREADVLITECAFKPGMESGPAGHLTPELAATAAKDAAARKLILTHFDASLYTAEKDRLEAQKAARRIFKNAVAAVDGMEVQVKPAWK